MKREEGERENEKMRRDRKRERKSVCFRSIVHAQTTHTAAARTYLLPACLCLQWSWRLQWIERMQRHGVCGEVWCTVGWGVAARKVILIEFMGTDIVLRLLRQIKIYR